jgi:hypothetical protein
MKNRLTLLIVSALLAVAPLNTLRADPFTIPVLGESWSIALDTPALDVFQGRLHDEGYQFQGASSNGFNISCFVEKPANDKQGHAACFDYYWTKMKRNPLIDPKSVSISKQKNFVRVSYDYTTSSPKLPSQHVNYYIAHKDRWIDIHISMVPALSRKDVTAALEKSLKLLPTDKPASGDDKKQK